MSKITYAGKVALNSNSGIADINKCNATDMNEIKSVVNENDDRLTTVETKIIPIEKYLTATAGSNGDFKVNIPNTLETGMIVNITFPTATVSSANARLSIDNGATYKNIFVNKSQSLARTIQSNSFSLRYDGTQWQIKCECYSTSETVVGTWTDGKPIYRKVYNIGSLPNNTTTFYDLGITNFGELIKKSPKWYDSADGGWISDFRFDSTAIKIIFFVKSSTSQLRIEGTGTNWATRTSDCTVTLEYTKTTD